MKAMTSDEGRRKAGLDQISTRWPAITDPVQFTIRYAPAIRGYLQVFLKNSHDVDDVCQNFLLRVLQKGLVQEGTVRGRFRHYLIAAVRNAALSHLRRRQPSYQNPASLADLPTAAEEASAADQEWLAGWHRCVLKNVWEALENHQHEVPGNLFHTVLRVLVDHPGEDSKFLAARTSALCGRPVQADAFRKQVSRARRRFAELLVEEVARTLEDPNPDLIEAELIDLGLMKYVRPFLPAHGQFQRRLSTRIVDR